MSQGPLQCMCGQCWYGVSADWPAVERALAVDGFSEAEIDRIRRVIDGRFEFYRPTGQGGHVVGTEFMIFKKEAQPAATG